MKIVKQFVLILGILAGSNIVWAYSYTDNRALLPLGEQEELMANTGVALSGSSGSVYYNPAGLVSIKKNQLSVSANAYLSTQTTDSPFMNVDSTDFNFSSKSFQAIPTELVSTWKQGLWTYAFSVLVPNQLKLQDSNLYSSSSYNSIQYSRSDSFQLLMGGFSAAAPFEGGYDLGAGCFYAIYQTSQQEALDGNPTVASGLKSLLVNTYFNAEVDGILCNLGLQYQQTEKLRWGVTVHLPLLPVNKQGTMATFAQAPANGNTQSVGPSGVNVDYEIPTDIGIGLEYKYNQFWTIYADFNEQFPVSYNDGTGTTNDYNSMPTGRVNTGLSYNYNEETKILGGLAYNPSSVGTANGASENFYVATLGFDRTSGNSNFGLGLFYAQSSGSIQAPIYANTFAQTGTKNGTVATQALGLLLNSGFVF